MTECRENINDLAYANTNLSADKRHMESVLRGNQQVTITTKDSLSNITLAGAGEPDAECEELRGEMQEGGERCQQIGGGAEN